MQSYVALCSFKDLEKPDRNQRNQRSEIDRNQRSEELLKLGGGQKIFIFRGEGLPSEWEFNFLGGGSYPSAYYVTFSFAYFLLLLWFQSASR